MKQLFLAIFAVLHCYANDPEHSYCDKEFEIRAATILDANGSKNAQFLDSVDNVKSAAECEWECCRRDECNVAVYEEKGNRVCYLIDCGPLNHYQCTFADHNDYTAIGLKIDRVNFDLGKRAQQHEHESTLRRMQQKSGNELTAPKERRRPYPQAYGAQNFNRYPTANCHPDFEWACWHGNPSCIAKYNLCTGIPQCADESDEDPELCAKLAADSQKARQRYRPYPKEPPHAQKQDASTQRKASLSEVHENVNKDRVEGETRQEAPADEGSSRAMKPDETELAGNSTSRLSLVLSMLDEVRQANRVKVIALAGGMCLLALALIYITCRARHRPRGGVRNRAKGFKPLPQSDTFDSDDDGEAAVLMKGLFIT